MINLAEASTLAFVMLFGSMTISTLGFGIGLTTTPFLLLFLDPKTAVILVNTVSLMLCALIIFDSRSHLNIKEVAGIGICGMLGVPLGVFILDHANISILRICITLLIIALTVSMQLRLPISLTQSRLTNLAVGFMVGVVITSLGVGGPLLAILFLKREWNRQKTRVSLALYFLLLQAAAVPAYLIAEMYTQEHFTLLLIIAIPVLIGYKFGTLLLRRMNEQRFRQAIVTVIMLISFFVLGREILHLQNTIS